MISVAEEKRKTTKLFDKMSNKLRKNEILDILKLAGMILGIILVMIILSGLDWQSIWGK